MKSVFPDLDSDLVPGKEAAGFVIGESFVDVSCKIGQVKWCGPDAHIRDVLLKSSSWVGVERRVGFGNELILSYRYMDEVVSLYFEGSQKLYRIAVGKGYRGSFHGVRPGDGLSKLALLFDLDFNADDDEFIVMKNRGDIYGISFVTDCRSSLEDVPQQIIQFVSIHDWSLR